MLFLLFEGDTGYDRGRGAEALHGTAYGSLEEAQAATTIDKESPGAWAHIAVIAPGKAHKLVAWFNDEGYTEPGQWGYSRDIERYRNAPKPVTAYKVLDVNTGLYMYGGSVVSWGPVGNVWSTANELVQHLNTIAATLWVNDRTKLEGEGNTSFTQMRAVYLPLSWYVVELSTIEGVSRPAATFE